MGTGVFWALYTCSGLHSALHAIPVASLSREIQTPEHSTWLDACLVDRWRNSLAFLGTVSRSQKHPLAGTGTKAVLLFPAAGIALFRSHTNEQLRHRIRGDLAHGQAYPTTRARHTVLTPGSRAVSREARRNATAAAAAAVVSWLGMLNSMLAVGVGSLPPPRVGEGARRDGVARGPAGGRRLRAGAVDNALVWGGSVAAVPD